MNGPIRLSPPTIAFRHGAPDGANSMASGPIVLPTNSAADAWESMRHVLETHFYEPDIEATRAIYAAVAAHRLPGAPVWPMLIGPPGSMKTELLSALYGLPSVHFIDQITPATFISGQILDGKRKSSTPPGLLHRIGETGVLVCTDFSTVTGINRNHRPSILADLRRIYDGHLRKEYGTAENLEFREWRGRITMVVGATPEVDREYSLFQSLGERFVMARWPRPGGTEAALCAMKQDRSLAKAELKDAVQRLFRALPDLDPQVPENTRYKVAALGELAVRGRTHIPRDGRTKEILSVPEPESNTRFPQQLCQLAKGSALIGGRADVGDQDYQIACRAALDSIPPMRRAVLAALIAGRDLCTAAVAKSTMYYLTEDLQLLGLLAGNALSPMTKDLLEAAGLA